MKHSRSEAVKQIVASYMKKRGYLENEVMKKYEPPLTRSAESSALSALVDMEASRPNSIMYKCVQNDPSVAEAQFLALKTWINEIDVPKTSEELKALLFPMLCHLYIEMLNGGHKSDAAAFLLKYKSLSTDEGLELIEELASIDNAKDITDKKLISSLRSNNYQVTLSAEAIQILKQYLIQKSHVIILQVINSWFDLEEARPCAEPLVDLCEDNAAVQANGHDVPSLATPDHDLAKIEEIIRLVNEGPTSPSPLCVYSVLNSDKSMTVGRVSMDGLSLLAAGYTTCQVRLWSLADEPLPKRPRVGSTQIWLAADQKRIHSEAFEDARPAADAALQYKTCCELLGHTGVVQDLAFMPSSELMVSVSMDKTMRAWNLQTYSCVSLYRGHNYPIWCVDASPLTGYVATGSHDRTARLWSLELNFPLRVFPNHSQDVDCVRFNPHGNYLATGSSDNTIMLWSVDTGKLVRVFEGHRSGVMALAFSPNGNQLASAGDDKRVKVWDLRNSSVVGEFRGFSDTVVSLDWSPNSDYVASCCMDNTVKICPFRNIINEGDASPTKFYQISCNSMSTIKYTPQNTPICVVGVKN